MPITKRTRWTQEEARNVLAEQEASGLSVTVFARRRGLNPKRLYRWRAAFREEQHGDGLRLVEFVPQREAPTGRVLLHAPTGHTLELHGVDLVDGLRDLAGCMAHLRRKLRVAMNARDPRATEALALVQGLYRVEELARLRLLDADQRLALRQERSVPIMGALVDWAEVVQPTIVKGSPLGKAWIYFPHTMAASLRLGMGSWLRLKQGACLQAPP